MTDENADDAITFEAGATAYYLGESVNESLGIVEGAKFIRFLFDIRVRENTDDIRRFAINVPIESAMSFLAILQDTARVQGYPMPEVTLVSTMHPNPEKL
jgi:hypothetical protein